MKAILFFLLILFSIQALHSQNPNFAWAKQMGGAGAYAGGSSIRVDASGNIYTTGEFRGVVDFDPGPAVFNLSSDFNLSDIFVSKSDTAGNFIWAKQIGGDDYDASFSIAIDAAGNVYTTGFFEGTADFDPGPGIFSLTAAGGGDSFISKLDASGNFVWAKQLAGPADIFIANLSLSIAIDASGNIFITGGFSGTVDFDPGPSIFNLHTALNATDIFISKLDAAGNFVWAKQLSGTGITWSGNLGLSISIDAPGNIYISGEFINIVDFDPGPGVFNLSTGSVDNGDIFVSKLDAAGNFVWAKQMHGVGYTFNSNAAFSIALDASGVVYATGFFQGTVDFDAGPGIFNLSSNGSFDIFIFKLDAVGNFIWAKQMGGAGDDEGVSIALDNTGNIYTTGYFNDIVDFDPGPAVFSLNSAGNGDIFVSKLDALGNFVWAKKIGGIGSDRGRSIVLDVSKNIYTTGSFQNTVDFDPGTGVFNLTVFGIEDKFIHKMSPCTNATSSNITTSVCSSYTLNGQTYTVTGVYTQILINAAGCDSIITLNLTINNRYTTFSAVACNSYLWNGQTYSRSGIYKDTLSTTNGCDSIITLNLVINSRTFSSINAAICNGQIYAGHTTAGTYIDTLVAANGCDSIRTLNLTVKPGSFSVINATICTGQSYEGYSTAGTYIDTLIAANGCDSIRTLNLTVKPRAFSTVDTSICAGQNYAGYTTSGTYTDVFTAANGCDSVRKLNLTVKNNCNIYIPNAFTPNNDGLNDLFKPTINLALQKFSFIIFNRYGEKIFETYEYGKGWDGTYKGKDQATGSYVYRITFTNSFGWELENNGTVLLLR